MCANQITYSDTEPQYIGLNDGQFIKKLTNFRVFASGKDIVWLVLPKTFMMEQNENEKMNITDENVELNNDKQSDENNEETNQENVSPAVDYEAKIAELNDKYLRLYSEFDNYRKRSIKEKSDIIRAGGEDVFKAIISSIDDFERAIKANETVTEVEPIKEGIALIYHKLKMACTAKGLEAMESIGKSFDADFMESITTIPSPTEDMKGKVIDEVEKGYKIGDKVIRFAKVIIGS